MTETVVRAHARLHLGFVDLEGGLGRHFGSFGLALAAPCTRVRIARGADCGQQADPRGMRIAGIVQRVGAALGLHEGLVVQVDEAIPEHVGLGSGTQLALAVAAGIAAVAGRDDVSIEELATLTGRGLRSGLGVALFRAGGFVVDGGRGARTRIPPALARLTFPASWRVLLVADARCEGLHGGEELRAFRERAPMAAATAGEICRRLLVQILPAVAEQDFQSFAEGLTRVQQLLGDYFSPHQGGRYTSVEVGRALEDVARDRPCGIGQSSWGPSGFAFLPDEASALAAEATLVGRGLQTRVLQAWNEGASIERIDDHREMHLLRRSPSPKRAHPPGEAP